MTRIKAMAIQLALEAIDGDVLGIASDFRIKSIELKAQDSNGYVASDET